MSNYTRRVLSAGQAIAAHFIKVETARGGIEDEFVDPTTEQRRPNEVSIPVKLLRALVRATTSSASGAAGDDLVDVCRQDADNYCRILSVLGMEEEGDPVAEVQRLVEGEPRISLHDVMESGSGWIPAMQIVDVPAVDEALRAFAEDQTGDNGTAIVAAVLEEMARQMADADFPRPLGYMPTSAAQKLFDNPLAVYCQMNRNKGEHHDCAIYTWLDILNLRHALGAKQTPAVTATPPDGEGPKPLRMAISAALQLLAWIESQQRLHVESWCMPGGVRETRVWGAMDREDEEPTGKAGTVIEALLAAKANDEARNG